MRRCYGVAALYTMSYLNYPNNQPYRIESNGRTPCGAFRMQPAFGQMLLHLVPSAQAACEDAGQLQLCKKARADDMSRAHSMTFVMYKLAGNRYSPADFSSSGGVLHDEADTRESPGGHTRQAQQARRRGSSWTRMKSGGPPAYTLWASDRPHYAEHNSQLGGLTGRNSDRLSQAVGGTLAHRGTLLQKSSPTEDYVVRLVTHGGRKF